MNIESIREQAERILTGDADNYDGADGARHVLELCEEINRLTQIIASRECFEPEPPAAGPTTFLKDLRLMICAQGTDFSAPWSQVPKEYQEDFKQWIGEEKQQTWDGIWERAWFNYDREYLAFLLNALIQSGTTTS